MRTVMTRLWRRGLVLSSAATLGFLALATAIGLVIDAPHLLVLQHRHAETSGQVVRLYPQLQVELLIKLTGVVRNDYILSFGPA